MGTFNKSDVQVFVGDEDLRAEIIESALNDVKAAKEIAQDIADEISDVLEDEPRFRRQLIKAAFQNPEFREKVMRELVNEFMD